jgi:hypothetical protein
MTGPSAQCMLAVYRPLKLERIRVYADLRAGAERKGYFNPTGIALFYTIGSSLFLMVTGNVGMVITTTTRGRLR